MAVTKTHPIKSTLKAAIDYILNPEKTDGKLLASSFGCGLETADIEFAWTREAAGDRGTHLGRHLIQVWFRNDETERSLCKKERREEKRTAQSCWKQYKNIWRDHGIYLFWGWNKLDFGLFWWEKGNLSVTFPGSSRKHIIEFCVTIKLDECI